MNCQNYVYILAFSILYYLSLTFLLVYKYIMFNKVLYFYKKSRKSIDLKYTFELFCYFDFRLILHEINGTGIVMVV